MRTCYFSSDRAIRQYAREKLFDAGESEKLRTRHLDYYVVCCEEAYPHIHGAGRLEWTRRLRREHDNIREALEWAFNDPLLVLQGLRIATAITDRFWMSQGLSKEGAHWLELGLQAAGNEIPKLMKARVHYGLCRIANEKEIESVYERCIALCREIGSPADRELCLTLAIHTC